MKQMPENRADVRELLRKQLALLAQKSKECEPMELYFMSIAMVEIANQLS